MTALPSKTRAERWTLYGRPMPGIDGPEPPKDGVEVMPVSEHRENCDRHERFVEELILDRERLRESLEQITNTLGSTPDACKQNTCEGCVYEMCEAARIAHEALKGEQP